MKVDATADEAYASANYERERVKKANANTGNKYKLIGREKNKKHTDI